MYLILRDEAEADAFAARMLRVEEEFGAEYIQVLMAPLRAAMRVEIEAFELRLRHEEEKAR